MAIPNYYESLTKPSKKYHNYCKYMPQHPFRMAVIGPSNTGKTNLLIYIIKTCKNFDKIYLYAKKLDEPLYEVLIKRWSNVGDQYGLNLIEYSNNISETVAVDDINDKQQNLIIFDDMVTEKNLKGVIELFIRGRKQNASIIFISQSYFSIPKDIRINCDYFVITKMGNKKELIEIAKDHTTDVNIDKFMQIYRDATKDPYSVLVIDLKTQYPSRKYRKNFKEVWSDDI